MALVALAAWAAVLAFAQAGLIREVGGHAPRWTGRLAASALLAGAAAAAFALAPGPVEARALIAGLAATAAALAATDFRWLVIPDLYVLAIAAPGLAGPLAPGLAASATGALLGGGLLWGVGAVVGRRLGREALGFGDVKLAAALGCLLGPVGLLWTVFAASAAGIILTLLRSSRRRPGSEPLSVSVSAAESTLDPGMGRGLRRDERGFGVAEIPFGALLAPVGVALLWAGRLG